MKNTKLISIIVGIIVIAVGVIVALDAFNVVNITLFFDGWWTLFIIIPCGIGLFTEKEKIGNVIGLIVGVVLLLCCQNVLNFDIRWKLFLPAIIVIFGLKTLLKGLRKNENAKEIEKISANKEPLRSALAVFGGVDMRLNSEVFQGAKLTAVFGGVECDLRNAIFEKDCVIYATVIFGGVDILLPENVNVQVNSNSVFGGVEDKEHTNKIENTVTVYVNGASLFGGIDVK